MKKSLVRIRHARSKKDFPFLSLEEGEYVELAITRSKAGLILLWAGVLTVMVLLGILFAVAVGALTRGKNVSGQTMAYFWMFASCIAVILMGLGLAMSKVYLGNKLFVTNKRIMHYKVESLFIKSVNVIDLARVEDVSFKQTTVLDHVFSMGTIRMSTVGDETTYTFKYVDTPKDEMDLIAHLVHNQKAK
ncbi:PH domain-containing protein [Candidatus Saccharibacteria bacterium]|nr:PH domain-containing protein [Candidatus Saccharibacteria bacterium]